MLSLDEILFDEEPHTYRYRGQAFASVTQIIRRTGLGEDFSHVPADRMEYARTRGRMVHLACQYFDEDQLDMNTIDLAIRGYVEAYMAFRFDKKIKVIATEKRMISPTLFVAGTPDLVCFMDGQRCVIDRKTSQTLSRSMGLQTAGYSKLWNAVYPSEIIRERYGLRLEKTGKYKLVPHDDYEDEPAFMDALHHARSLERMARWEKKYVNR